MAKYFNNFCGTVKKYDQKFEKKKYHRKRTLVTLQLNHQ
jgi:hypothetical protein